MATKRKLNAKSGGQTQEAAVAKIQEVYKQYGKYAVPIEDLWEIMEKELGPKTLTEELRAMREGR